LRLLLPLLLVLLLLVPLLLLSSSSSLLLLLLSPPSSSLLSPLSSFLLPSPLLSVDARGQYSTYLFTEKVVEIIEQHEDKDSPLFLYVPYQVRRRRGRREGGEGEPTSFFMMMAS